MERTIKPLQNEMQKNEMLFHPLGGTEVGNTFIGLGDTVR